MSFPVFVVSLKESTDRRKHLEKHLKSVGLDFEWFDAVNGKELSQDEINKLCDIEAIKKFPIWLSPGAIGCSLSHYYLYLEIIKRNLPYALILEDDIILEKNFSSCVESLLKTLLENEIVTLFYQSKKPLKLISSSRKIIYENFSTYIPENISQPLSTGAYVITLDACRTLSKVVLPVRSTADMWGNFYKLGGFKSLRCVYPRPVESTDSASTIQYKNTNWKFNFKQIVDRYKIFPVYHFLRHRRRMKRQKMMIVEIK